MYKRRRTHPPTYPPVRYVEFNVCVHNVVWKVGTRRRSGYVPVCLSPADVRARLTSRSPFYVGKSVPDPRSFPLYRACVRAPVIVRPAMMNGREGTPDSQDKDWLYRQRAKLSCCPPFHGRWRDTLAVVWLKRVKSIRTVGEAFLCSVSFSPSRHKGFIARACVSLAHLFLIAQPRE